MAFFFGMVLVQQLEDDKLVSGMDTCSMLPDGTGIWHYAFIFLFDYIVSVPSFFFFFFGKLVLLSAADNDKQGPTILAFPRLMCF